MTGSKGAAKTGTASTSTGRDVDVGALEEAMDEVVETLAVAEQAAEFVRDRSSDPDDRARAAAVQQQAEAMLDAAEQVAGERAAEEEASPPPPSGARPGETIH
ncbi:hypothetical protein [Azospirillum thermophilum]|uniref:Uncharacterized protein n=1 Tax=Azospirillum thermophilum TaxID=2202148 RepID=A0A2S2CM76_9PROT|nr:hypothetical protein [Azospirillum thermophilum]AWK85566.1 hypothetical protein DEW08_04745 [Azospirillum thermophilum]